MKRIFALLLAMVMVLGMFPASAIQIHATEAEEPAAVEKTEPEATTAPETEPTAEETETASEETAPAATEETEPSAPEEVSAVETAVKPAKKYEKQTDRKPQSRKAVAKKVVSKTVTDKKTVRVVEEIKPGVFTYKNTVKTIERVEKSLAPISALSIRVDEEGGDIFFTTFEDLKEIASDPNYEYCWVTYEGEGPLVIREDLELDKISLYFCEDNSQLVVPEGVTFTVNGDISVDELTVNGTLINDYAGYVNVNTALTITGRFENYGTVTLNSYTVVTGEDKLVFAGEEASGVIFFGCFGMEDLKAAAAAEEKENWYNYACIYAEEDWTINESVSFMTNIDLEIAAGGNTITLAQGCTLAMAEEADLWVYSGTLKVNGTLNCDNYIRVYRFDGANVAFSNTGSFRGNGCMEILCNEDITVEALLPNLDLTNIYAVNDNGSWLIYDITGKIQLSAPTDLTWNKAYVWDSDTEEHVLVERKASAAWKQGALTDSFTEIVFMHREPGETEFYEYDWLHCFNQSGAWNSADTLAVGNIEDGDYYFTLRSLANQDDHYNSDVVQSGIYSYTKPETTVATPNNLRWIADANGGVSTAWDGTVSYYEIELLCSHDEELNPEFDNTVTTIYGDFSDGTLVGIEEMIEYGEGYYYFRVRAISDNIEEAYHSGWSAYSPAYHYYDAAANILEALEHIRDTATTPADIRAAMQNVNAADLKAAMEASAEVRACLQALEITAGGPVAAAVASGEIPFAADRIHVLGGNLNTPVSADEAISLVIDKAEKPHTLTGSYDMNTAVNFSMQLRNVQNQKALGVPIQVTLPVPDTIPAGVLTVIAYAEDGTAQVLEPMEITQTDDQTLVTLILSGLGDFTMTADVLTQEEFYAEIMAACENGENGYDLTKPVVVSEDMALTFEKESSFTIRIREGGSLTIAEDAALTLNHYALQLGHEDALLTVNGKLFCKEFSFISVNAGTMTIAEDALVDVDVISLNLVPTAKLIGWELSKTYGFAYVSTVQELIDHFDRIDLYYGLELFIDNGSITLNEDLVIPKTASVSLWATDLVVPAGVTLTNEGQLYVNFESNVTIEENAELVNNGYLLLYYCSFDMLGSYRGRGEFDVDADVTLNGSFVQTTASAAVLEAGDEATLTANVIPDNAAGASFVWSIESGSECVDMVTDGNTATVTAKEIPEDQTVTIKVATTDDSISATTLTIEVEGNGACSHTGKTEVSAVAPTCTQPGNNKYYVCDCGVVLKADGVTETTVEAETIPALGHDYVETVVAPGYTTPGYTEHACSRCGDTYRDAEKAAKGLPKPVVTAEQGEAGKPVLTWDAIEEADGYSIYRATKKSGKYTELATVAEACYVDETAEIAKTYYYKVKAVCSADDELNSKESSVVSVKTKCAPTVIHVQLDVATGKPAISWEAVEGARKYDVYRATSENGKYSKTKTVSTVSYIDTGASVGKTYYYKVKAVASSSTYNSGYSNILSCYTVCAQPNVTVKLSATTGKPELSWKKVTGASKYEILRATALDGEYTSLSVQKGTSYKDVNAAADTAYFYKVNAIASKEANHSIDGVPVSITASVSQPAIKTAVSDAATGLPLLTWEAVEGAVSYEISRASKSKGTYEVIGTVSELSFTDETAAGGKTWYYKLTAITAKGTRSAASSYKSAKCICAAPVIDVQLDTASGKARISWDAVDGARKYDVYRATSENGKYSKAKTVTTLSCIDTGASVGKTYYYKVKAVASSSSYNSGYSSILSCYTICAQPKVTVKLNAATGKPELSWKKVTGASKYEILRATTLEGEYISQSVQKGTSYKPTDLEFDVPYFYKVNAIAANADNNSADAAPISVAAACAQPAIKSVTNHRVYGSPVLEWNAVKGATSYEISRAAKSRGSYEAIGTTTELTFMDRSAEAGKTHYYKITALTANSRSADSAYKSAKSICAQPMVVMGVNYSTGKPTLEWEAIAGAKKYEIYRTVNPTGKYTKIATITGLYFEDTKAPAATTCHYKVRAVASSSGYNSNYAEYLFAPSLCTRPVVTVKVNATTGQPELSWKKVSGAVSYEIFRAAEENGTYESLAVQTALTYKDTDTIADTVYFYKLVAKAKNPVYDSYETAPISVTTTCAAPVITSAAADEVTGKPKLAWNAVNGAVSYKVVRCTKKSGTYEPIGTVTEPVFLDESAVTGKTYYYKVAAEGVNSVSSFSAYKSVKCLMAAPVVTSWLSGNGNVHLSWTEVPGAAKYEVYRSESESTGYSKVKTVTTSSTFHIVPDQEKMYYFKVRAVSAGGTYSPFSAPVPSINGKMEISRTKLTMELNQTYSLSADFGEEDFRFEKYWSSSNEEVALVVDGMVYSRTKEGTAVITVTNGLDSAQCTVTVAKPQLDTLQILTPNGTILFPGDTFQLEYHYAGEGELTWSSSSTEVLTVSDTGLVTAAGEGSAVVTVTDGTRTRKMHFDVRSPEEKITEMKRWENGFLYDGVTKVVGDSLSLTVETEENPQMGNITYTTTDQGIVSVEWDSTQEFQDPLKMSTWLILRFHNPGTATVTITSEDRQISWSYTIHVKEEYDCYPGKEKLTPEEFAYYATQVGVEMGHTESPRLQGYYYDWYTDEELTWENAVSMARGTAHNNYRLGIYSILVTYDGIDEDNGEHLFFKGY